MDPGGRRIAGRRTIKTETERGGKSKRKTGRKRKEKSGKKTTRAQEPTEEEPVVHKTIKITVRRPEPKLEDFVQKIRFGTTTEEEAEEEESSEPLERHAPKRGREQRAKEPAPPVGGTQQRAKEPTLITEGVEEQRESRAAQNEAAPNQLLSDIGQEHVLPDFDNEQVIPNLGSEQVSEPETSAR